MRLQSYKEEIKNYGAGKLSILYFSGIELSPHPFDLIWFYAIVESLPESTSNPRTDCPFLFSAAYKVWLSD